MKKLLLSGIAALFLATGTAHAGFRCSQLNDHGHVRRWCRFVPLIEEKADHFYCKPYDGSRYEACFEYLELLFKKRSAHGYRKWKTNEHPRTHNRSCGAVPGNRDSARWCL